MKASASSFLCFVVLTANEMGTLQDSYGKTNGKWTGKRTGTPCWSSTPTTGARSPLGDSPALPDGEDGFTLSLGEQALC